MHYCPNCGHPNRDTAKFCVGCGASQPARNGALSEGAPSPTPAASFVAPSNTPPLSAATPIPPPESSGALCPNCQKPNRIGAKFCRDCSEPLTTTRKCPHCGAQNRLQARHCRQCGRNLMAFAPPRLGTGNLVPKTLVANRYQIIRKLAQGGMGAVYLVSDTHLYDPQHQREKQWALKEMSEKAFPADQLQQAVDMFQREARMLAHLQHANLPEVVDLFEHQSKYYLVMTYIEGETLEAILQKKNAPLALDTVMKWTNQLCGVLGYLHVQTPPIIYRDLKLSNVMVEQKTGLLKVIDFGIARFQRKRTSKHLKQPGQHDDDAGIGTIGYAPPEQWRKGEVTTQADVYALGVILHQLLTNHDPASTPFNLPPISQLNPAVPPRLAQVIARAYANDAAQRYATVFDFQRDFIRVWHDEFKGWSGGNKAGDTQDSSSGSTANASNVTQCVAAPRIIDARVQFETKRLEQAAWVEQVWRLLYWSKRVAF